MIDRWSLRYWGLRYYIKFWDWIYHRQIVVRGTEHIPVGKPVIYAPNHQNALSDALAVVCHVPHQPVWLARADIFKSPLTRPLLKFLKIIPVFRIRDGKENLSGNDETFSTSVEVLKSNHALALFPEASHSGKRSMLTHKKAIPRIVFMAEERSDFTLDIHIVPVGIFYDQYANFGRRLMVSFGKPLKALDYKEKYLGNPHGAMMSLKDDLFRAMLPLVLHFESRDHYEGFEAIREVAGKRFLFLSGLTDTMPNRLLTDQHLVEKIHDLENRNPEAAAELADKALALVTRLKSLGLRNWLVDPAQEKILSIAGSALLLLISFPLFLYGFLFNVIPFAGLDLLVKRKVKDPVWISTFTFSTGLVVFPLFYLAETILISPLLPGWIAGMLFLISLPFAGKFAFSWMIRFLKTRGKWRWLLIKRHHKELYQELTGKKEEILTALIG